MGAVADVERTGQYTPDGQELLDVSLSSGAVPLIRSALSEQTGGMVTTAELVAQLNTVENVSAVQNEDGSVTLEVPEGVYAEYEGYRLHDIVYSFYVAFRAYHDIRAFADRRGVDIVNITPASYIDAFPRASEIPV